MAFNKARVNQRVFPKDKTQALNVRETPKVNNGVVNNILFSVPDGKLVGLCSGNFENIDGYTWYEVITEKGKGWVRNDVITLGTIATPTVSTDNEEKTKSALKELTELDNKNFYLIKKNEQLIEVLKAKNVPVADAETKLKKLADNYNKRQKQLKEFVEGGLLKNLVSAVNQKFIDALNWFKSVNGIGVLPLLLNPWVIGGSIAIATIGITALWSWLATGPKEQAKKDWDENGELEKFLLEAASDGVLTKEEKDKFQAFQQQYGQSLYDAGYKEGKDEKGNWITDLFGDAKTIVFVGGGLYLADRWGLFNNKKSR